jgi:hypothetical protein
MGWVRDLIIYAFERNDIRALRRVLFSKNDEKPSGDRAP